MQFIYSINRKYSIDSMTYFEKTIDKLRNNECNVRVTNKNHFTKMPTNLTNKINNFTEH